ncbi:MAG: hypothetical protein KAK00_01510 [Nanoarchaeota archaeon]|nr:hypothetical protein [Nanoarchaeota archaeon]
MVEKHLVVDGKRFNYSGMFDINEFFKEVDDWTDNNKFERETKKKLEHVSAENKKMEYVFELWKNAADYAKVIVRLKVLFEDVVDFDLKRGDHKRNMQKGRVLVIIDGFLETDLENRWQQKPAYVFIRTLYDKLVWKFWLGKYDGVVASSCSDFYNKLFAYFKKYKY